MKTIFSKMFALCAIIILAGCSADVIEINQDTEAIATRSVGESTVYNITITAPTSDNVTITGASVIVVDSNGEPTGKSTFVTVNDTEGYVTLSNGNTLTLQASINVPSGYTAEVMVHTVGTSLYTPVAAQAAPGEVVSVNLSATSAKTNGWMARLSDAMLVSQVSIPGTHNAATSKINGMGKCQSLTIAEQLNIGVRGFCLRPTLNRKLTFKGYKATGLGNIYHGTVNTKVSTAQAFDAIDQYLEANPEEFVVIVMRNESGDRYLTGSAMDSEFVSYMRTFLESRSRVVNFHAHLTVGECRGKIVVLNRTGSTSDMAASYMTWNHNQSGSTDRRIYSASGSAEAAVQDCYAPGEADGDCSDNDFASVKPACVEDFMDFAASASNQGRNVWVVNYASAYTGLSNYAQNAENTNGHVFRYLAGKEGHITTGSMKVNGPVGIVMMDFAGARTVKYMAKSYTVNGDLLTQSIIDNNFK